MNDTLKRGDRVAIVAKLGNGIDKIRYASVLKVGRGGRNGAKIRYEDTNREEWVSNRRMRLIKDDLLDKRDPVTRLVDDLEKIGTKRLSATLAERKTQKQAEAAPKKKPPGAPAPIEPAPEPPQVPAPEPKEQPMQAAKAEPPAVNEDQDRKVRLDLAFDAVERLAAKLAMDVQSVGFAHKAAEKTGMSVTLMRMLAQKRYGGSPSDDTLDRLEAAIDGKRAGWRRRAFRKPASAPEEGARLAAEAAQARRENVPASSPAQHSDLVGQGLAAAVCGMEGPAAVRFYAALPPELQAAALAALGKAT